MTVKTVTDLDRSALAERTVLVRADLNVPLDGHRITDDRRIRATLPTLEILVEARARVVVLSHLGRPKGEVRPEFSLAPVSARLAELLEMPVLFVPEPVGHTVEADVHELGAGRVALLENTRFVPGETANDPELAAEWASLGDVFVNDAFGAAHRAHASTSGLADAVRAHGGEAVAGLLMARELRFLGEALDDPARPFVALLGGAKISGKIDVVEALLPRVDRLLIGGAMANTCLRALGLETGLSLVEEDRIEMASNLLDRAGDKILLPVDCVVAPQIEAGAKVRTLARDVVGGQDRIVDIGPATTEIFRREIERARTVVWNGPMGIFEVEDFAAGTLAMAEATARACDEGAIGVLGGGDSAAAAEQAGVTQRLTHVSTGGGASLEFLAGAVLPGVAALTPKD